MNEIQDKINSIVNANNNANNNATNAVHVHSFPLTIGDASSHTDFCARLEKEFGGSVDVLVNNAGFAYKGSDPTPFREQTAKTLETNYYGLVDFTQRMLPLLRKGTDARIVTVASMAGRLGQVSPELRARFSDPALTIEQLNGLVNEFEGAVRENKVKERGWSKSNYGVSKLAAIAATGVFARREAGNHLSINSCCPGYCDTDMTSHRGPRPPEEGAKNAVIPATMDNPPTGKYFADYKLATW